MFVYRHPSRGDGWWLIKISHGRKEKVEYIPFYWSRDEAKIFERELRGETNFRIAYKNRFAAWRAAD